jgi:hypothetical protein
MKILILRSTVAEGKPVEAGSVIDVPDEDGAFLIRLGKATADLPKPKPAGKGKAQ